MDLSKKKTNEIITDIQGKLLSITGLASTAALNEIENKMPNVNNLVIKGFWGKTIRHESKYFTTSDYNNKFKNKILNVTITIKRFS